MKQRTIFQRFVQGALFLAVVMIGVTSLGLTARTIKIIAGTGASVSAVDNTTTGQQEWTISATGSGGTVSDVAAGTSISVTNPTGPTATVSVTPTGVTAATYGDPTHVMSCAMNAEGQATSCSNVAITGTGVTLTSGSGMNVTGGPAYVVNLAVPVAAANGGTGVVSPPAHGVAVSEGSSPFAFAPAGTAGIALVSLGSSSDPAFNTVLTVGGGTGVNTAGTTGNVLTSSAGTWVSAAPAPPLTGAQFGEMQSGSSSFVLNTAAYSTLGSFTVTVAAGQVVLVTGGVEGVCTLAAGSYSYGVGVDSVSLTSASHRADCATGAAGDGAVVYLATGLSAGSHTIRFLAGFASVGSGIVGGWSVVVQVLGS